MSIEVTVIKLENNPDKALTIHEIETIYKLSVLEYKTVICGLTDRTEDIPVDITNIYANDKEMAELIKSIFTAAKVGVIEESTGLANYKYQVWTAINKAEEILLRSGVTINKFVNKEEAKKTEPQLTSI